MADNEKLLKNLFAAVEQALFFGDRTSSSEFGFLMQPGFFVSPKLTEADSSADMAIIYNLTNQIIDTQCYYTPQIGTLEGWYDKVIEETALPYQALTPAQEREVQDIKRWLYENRPNYVFWRDQYDAAVAAYNAEVNSQIPNGAELARLRQLKADRLADWNTFGLRQTYQNKTGRITYLTRRDPSAFWDNLRSNKFDQARQAPKFGTYFQTFLVPPPLEWGSASWSRFTRSIKESETYSYSRSVSWSGGVGFRWGLFNSINVGASGERTVEVERGDATNLDVDFEYQRVMVRRPWLDENVFTLSNWTWKNTFASAKYPYLSDGGDLRGTPGRRPIGVMPFLPTSLIVARNVTLSANFSSRDRQLVTSRIQGSLDAGIGWFSVRGNYQESTREETAKASFDGVTLRIREPQVIGMFGTLLPRCPDPDRGLPWQGDHTLPPVPSPSEIPEFEEAYFGDYLNTLRNEMLLEAETESDLVRSTELQRLKSSNDRTLEKMRRKKSRTPRDADDGDNIDTGTSDAGRKMGDEAFDQDRKDD